MKFQVQMKDPDTLYDAIQDAVNTELKATGLDEEERELLYDYCRTKVSAVCSKWFAYGEYLTVEIDTDHGTCVVLEHK